MTDHKPMDPERLAWKVRSLEAERDALFRRLAQTERERDEARAEVTRLRARAAALEAELRTAINVIEDVAPRPWSADLDDPCDEQDSGEYDDEPWVVTDANEATVDRVGGKNEPSNGEWARDYAATVNALGTSLDEMAAMPLEPTA